MAQSQSEKAAAKRRAALNPKIGAEGGDGRGIPVVHNMTPEDKAKAALEQEEAQVISIINRVKAKRAVVAEKKAKKDEASQAHKEAVEEVNKVFKDAGMMGYKRNALEELYEAVHEKGVRKNQEAEEQRRARWRRFYNLPVADSRQQELEAALPATEKDGQDYEADGYKAGLNSEERKAPAAAVKAGHDQRWLTGYDAGTARKAWSLTALKAIPMPSAAPKTAATPAPEAPAEGSGEAV